MTPLAARVSELVRDLRVQPHPEGGYYHETYRCGQSVLRAERGRPRSASTAIYYLLDGNAYSAWHRIASDEIWHFYAGGPLHVHVLLDEGRLVTHRLGNALVERDAVFQARSEEHTSELQSLMRISYAVFCLKKKKQRITHI